MHFILRVTSTQEFETDSKRHKRNKEVMGPERLVQSLFEIINVLSLPAISTVLSEKFKNMAILL